MTTDQTVRGRAASDIVEGGAGGEFHRALALAELDTAAYVIEEEFAYDINEPATDLLRLCGDLRAHLARLSVTYSAELTLNRECGMCSGVGAGCPECGNDGYVHADEADG